MEHLKNAFDIIAAEYDTSVSTLSLRWTSSIALQSGQQNFQCQRAGNT
jgi:hypothetical protein